MRGGGPHSGGAHADHRWLSRHRAPRPPHRARRQDQEGGAHRHRVQRAKRPRADWIQVEHLQAFFM